MQTTYSYDKANRLKQANSGGVITTYAVDAAGNRLNEVSPSESSYYTWDAAGRMATAETEAGIVTFTYNADGQRIAKQSTDGSVTGYLYDGKRMLHETDEVGGEISRTYASDTTDEFGDLIGEEGEYVHQYDAQANTNALLDASGAVEAKYKYDAFGQVAAVSMEGAAWSSLMTWDNLSSGQWAGMSADAWANLPPELSTQMLAGGKKQYYLDPEIELYLLGSGQTNGGGRYYDAAAGRFLSEDPERRQAGAKNLQNYTQNDPINNLDPSGHETEKEKAERLKKAEEARRIGQKPSSMSERLTDVFDWGLRKLTPAVSSFEKMDKVIERAGLDDPTILGHTLLGAVGSQFSYEQDAQKLGQSVINTGKEFTRKMSSVPGQFISHPVSFMVGEARGLGEFGADIATAPYTMAPSLTNLATDAAASAVGKILGVSYEQKEKAASDVKGALGQLPGYKMASAVQSAKEGYFNTITDAAVGLGANREAVDTGAYFSKNVATVTANVAPVVAEVAEIANVGRAGAALSTVSKVGEVAEGAKAAEAAADISKVAEGAKVTEAAGSASKAAEASRAASAADDAALAGKSGTAASVETPAVAKTAELPKAPAATLETPQGAIAAGETAAKKAGATDELASWENEGGALREGSHTRTTENATNGKPQWLQNIDNGNTFNKTQSQKYPYNEVYVQGKEADYVRLDSYNPQAGEIVSRKFTQFSEIKETTGIKYINELARKYAPGTKIANVPTSGDLAGQPLRGQMFLEIPVQNKPIPQAVLDAAKKANVKVRDVEGRVY